MYIYIYIYYLTQSAGAVEYIDCISKSVLDMTLNNKEASIMLELWEMQSTPLLPSLPGPLRPGVVVPHKVLSMS